MGSSEALRLALLNPCFWPEVRRGSERVARDLADGLIAAGHRPTLITSHRGWRRTVTMEDGLEVIRNPRPPDGRLRRRGYEDHLTHVPLSLLSLIRGDYDVAHALYSADAVAAGYWGERTGRPALFSFMGFPTRPGLLERRRRLDILLRAMKDCTETIVLSDAVAAAFERELGLPTRVIRPGIRLDKFTPGGERAAAPTILCTAAAEEPRKRVRMLVRSVELLRKTRPDARLVLNRPRDAATASAFEALGDWIELRNLDSHDALLAAYREAWVCALPSFAEAFGLILVEAMACGTPVVGPDRDAFPEIVDSSAVGSLFEDNQATDLLDDPADAAALARALDDAVELTSDSGTPAACRARAEQFPIEGTISSYIALYEELRAA